MNSISMSSYRPYQKLHPLSLLAQLISRQANGCLKVTNASMSWFIYLERGKLLYASTSMDAFERLDRHLQHLSSQTAGLGRAVRLQSRFLFDKPLESEANQIQDYQAICWLVEQEHLNIDQATGLIEDLAKEVLASFLTVQEGSYELIENDAILELPKLCRFELRPLVESCQHHLQQRQAQQRQAQQRQAQQHQVPTLPVAPVKARPRSNPFSNAKGTDANSAPSQSASTPQTPVSSDKPLEPSASPPAPVAPKTTYTIACIDDSPTVLNAIKLYLDDKSFNVVMIDDPVKALMQVIRSKPDLILLDVTMPHLDGYELCSILKKHPSFKHTPIIMVTGKTGFIDRAKAKLTGASGYLSKPFSQPDLIKVVFQHLS